MPSNVSASISPYNDKLPRWFDDFNTLAYLALQNAQNVMISPTWGEFGAFYILAKFQIFGFEMFFE